MNTYSKYCPNVFVAKCTEQHESGEIIIVTTKYGKEVENEVHNYMGKTKDGHFLYSITRVDGLNSQQRATTKAGKLEGYASNADNRSNAAWEASKEGRDFLSLGEPIKIGHHSERRHRKLIERNWARMGKAVAESEKAEEYRRRAEYWEERANKIDLSMPDSLEYFEYELDKAKTHHQFLRNNPSERSHSMSLQYANKAVNDLQAKVNLAIRLWGSTEDIHQLEEELKVSAEEKQSKKKSANVKKFGGFFAFNYEQFRLGYDAAKEGGFIEDGEKVTHIKAGLYIPTKLVDAFLAQL